MKTKSFFVWPLLVASLATLTFPLPSWAQDATEPASEKSEEDTQPSFFEVTTVTATGTETDAFELPISVSVIENLEERSENNAADLLLTEPGVDVNGVGTNQTRPIIRGQRGLRVLLLEDGLSLNNPRRQTDFGEITGLVDLDRVEKVEVVRGPSSVLYGSGAIGGVLNLVTRVPSYGGGNALGGGVELRSSSADEQEKASLNLHGQGRQLAWAVDYSYRDAEDYEAPAGSFGDITLDDDVTVFDTGVQDDTLAAYLGYRFSDRHEIFVRTSRYRADETGFGFVDPALLEPDFDGTQTRIFYPFQDFDRFTLGYTGSGLDASWADNAELRLYDQSNERELAFDAFINIGPIFPGAPDSSLDLDTLNFTDLDTTGVRAELTKALSGKHLLTYGAEHVADDSLNTDFSRQELTLRFAPGVEFTDVVTSDVANTPNAENVSYAAFVQGEVLLNDKLKAILGARYQNVETNAKATPGRDITGLDFSDDALVGAFQLLYSVTDNFKLMGSYATAFRAPSIVERLFNGLTPEGSGFQISNPDLVSEESDNFDFGFKYRRARAYLDAVYFENDIDNGIIQYFLSPAEIGALPADVRQLIESQGVDFVVQQRNIDRLKIEGVELATGYRFEKGFEIDANYTHLKGERIDSDNPPTGDTPSDKYNLSLRYAPLGARYRFEYRLRRAGDEDLIFGVDDPVPPVGLRLPAFTVQTLSGFVTVFERNDQRHVVGLTIENLADDLYAEFTNVLSFRPAPGRNFVLSYHVRF